MYIIDLLVICFSPHLEALAHLSTPEVLWARKRAPTPCPSIVFTFGLVIESIQEFGGVSKLVCGAWFVKMVWEINGWCVVS
jgi:hypothetical protein